MALISRYSTSTSTCITTADTTYHSSAATFLKAHPNGIYTTLRTLSKTRIILFDHHINRLLQNMSDFGFVDMGAFTSEVFVREAVGKMITDVVRRCNVEWAQKEEGEDELVEFRILVWLGVQDTKPRILSYAQPFAPAPNAISDVLFIGAGARPTPTIKSSDWVIHRAPYEAQLKPPIVEGVLYSPTTGNVYEGLLTTFYVIMRDEGRLVVVTAPPGAVLEGTSCWLVERACTKLEIGFVRRYPNIRDVCTWEGAFISSALRTCHTVSAVHLKNTIIGFSTHQPLLDSIRNQVINSLHSFSTSI